MFTRLKSFVSTPTSSVPSTPGDQTPPPPGHFKAPLPKAEHLAALREAVPCAECDSCEDEATTPADEEHYPSFPKKFDMDQESEMLGTCSASALLRSSFSSTPPPPFSSTCRLRAQALCPAARLRREERGPCVPLRLAAVANG
jgi:hypothetical protein